jgi:hypothetical protein
MSGSVRNGSREHETAGDGGDFFQLLVHSKKDATEMACLRFKKKYGMDYESFVRIVEEKKNEGDYDFDYFEMRNDQMDWEFAEAARRWWTVKIKMSEISI